MKLFACAGAVFAFFAVACGAFGAHSLRELLTPDRMAIFQTAVQYQAMHALALLALGLADPNEKSARTAGLFFVAGIVIFSGSLYGHAISGIKILGAITPLGGACFLIGWAILAVGLYRKPHG